MSPRFLLLVFFLLMKFSLLAQQALPVNEHRFLEQPFDFSPPEEKALDEKWVQPPEKPFPFAEARLEKINGVQTIVVDGEPMPSWSRATKTPVVGTPVERQMREEGVRLFIVEVNLTAEGEKLGDRRLATAPQPAFDEFRQRADRLLASVPDAKIIIRLWMLNVAGDYVEAHPDALLQGADGTTDWGWPYYHGLHQARPNMLNEWRRYCAGHLYRFIHELGASSYAPKVAGFYIGAMNSGEWWYYKGKGDPGWDYSPTRKAAFRKLALAKYGSRKGAAEAWGVPDDEQTFDLPSLSERQRWPLLPQSKSADYLQTLNLPVTSAALYFAKVIKAATGGRSLAGMEIHAAYHTAQNNGTVFLDHLLASPDLDLLGGPSAYKNRRPGQTPLYRVAAATVEAHGKLWWNEGDYRTHTAYGTPSAAAGEPPTDAAAMRHVFRREFARGAVFNYPTYLMDFGWNWFYEPSLMQSLGEVLEADALIRRLGRKPRAEVAVVTDQESQLYSNYYSNPLGFMLDGVLDRIGLGWDCYGLADFLKEGRADSYRMVIFLNIRALSNEERAGIARLKSKGRVLLWMHDPGAIDLSGRGRSSAELVSELTGIEVAEGPIPQEVHVIPGAFEAAGLVPPPVQTTRFQERKAVLFQEVSLSDTAEGWPIGDRPSPYSSVDREAVSLVEDDRGRSFLALKRFDDWTSVYTAFCEIDPGVIRQLARQAGCFLYHDGNDVFFGGGNLVALHAASSGEKVIAFPESVDVYDLFERKVVARESRSVRLPMRKGETRVLYLGDAAAAEVAAKEIAQERRSAREAFVTRYPAPSMPDVYRSYLPKSPAEGGELEVTAYTPPALMIAGPFDRDAATLKALDARLASLITIEAWQPLPGEAEGGPRFGMHSDRFLHVVQPMALRVPVEGGKIPWYGIELVAPGWHRQGQEAWINDFRLGMATGQSYAGAFYLSAKEAREARLFFAVEGEARLWVDGEEVKADAPGLFEPRLSLSPEPRLVVFRVQGGSEATGFALKLAAAERGRASFVQQRTGTYNLLIDGDPDSLESAPPGLLIGLPGK